MSKAYERIRAGYEYCRKVTDFEPKVALILGSGLGNYARNMKIVAEIPYRDIPGFPVSTVAGHDGKFLFGYIGQVPMVVMKGRVHFYEGYSMEDVVLPTRLMKELGAEILILTNASGGINPKFQAGDFMMITDQISCFVPSPLVGANVEELGVRFPDMTYIYDLELQEKIRIVAKKEQISLQEGVYVQASGPNFESPAEIRMFGILGADTVGMSTACEAIAANHAGMKVCGISFISNMASGISGNKLTHEEVQETADKKAPEFEQLITRLIEEIGEEEKMVVTYIEHSGLSVELPECTLLFDYYLGKLPEFPKEHPLIVFASHVHGDHFQKKIFQLREQYQEVYFVLSDDIPKKYDAPDVIWVSSDVKVTVAGCEITCLKSTDEGVAFLVKCGEKTVYHAGDLNWWHWE